MPENMGFVRWENYIPDISPWLEPWFSQPLPSQGPMRKGKPQEPAGNRGGQVKTPANVAEDVGASIEAAVNRILGNIFSKEHVRDGAVYGAAILLMVIVIWSALK